MEGQMSISDTALDAIVIQANYRMGKGWDVAVSARANGQTWQDSPRRVYDYLTTDELAQVLGDELEHILGG